MKTKTKIIISVLAFFAVVIAAAVTIVTVLAASKKTLSSNLTVNYEASEDVYASITGGVYSDNTKVQDINVSIAGKTKTGSFNLDDIKIDSKAQEESAYIDLIITNEQTEDISSADLYITQTFSNLTATNITKTRLISFNDDTNYEEFTENNILVRKNQKIYLRLKFDVTDIYENATLTGKIDLSIIHCTQVNRLPSDMYNSTIATIGEYPQTYVGETLNTELQNASAEDLKATTKTYTTDVNGEEKILQEYEYNGVRVVKLEGSKVYSSGYKFSTGDVVVSDKTYFFYVQPIKICLAGTKNDKIIVTTKNILFSKAFNPLDETNYSETSGYNTNWETCTLRQYLNTTFLSESGITATKTSIENTTSSGNNTYQPNTEDSIWLPSYVEVSSFSYSAKRKIITDFACATYTYKGSTYGEYWTRSASDSKSVRTIYYNTYSVNYKPTYTYIGISVAFAL